MKIEVVVNNNVVYMYSDSISKTLHNQYQIKNQIDYLLDTIAELSCELRNDEKCEFIKNSINTIRKNF